MSPDSNGNGKNPTATELYEAMLKAPTTDAKVLVLGRMVAMHIECDGKWRTRVSVTISGLLGAVLALGGALLTHALG